MGNYGYIYKITNKINGKTYIGQRRLSLDKDWYSYMGSGMMLPAAYEKYGVENFAKDLICYAKSPKELDELESYHIKKEKAKGKAEYNIQKHVPQANHKKLTDEEFKLKMNLSISKGLRASRKHKLAMEKVRASRKAKKEDIKCIHKDEIINKYSELGSMQKVSEVMNLSPKLIREVLLENDVKLRPLTGWSHKKETLDKISNKNQDRTIGLTCIICCKSYKVYKQKQNRNVCSKECAKAQKSIGKTCLISEKHIHVGKGNSIPTEELMYLYKVKKMKINELAAYYQCGNRLIYYKLKESNIPYN